MTRGEEEALLHQDENVTCRLRGTSVFISVQADASRIWSHASPARDATFRAIDIGCAALQARFPGTRLQVAWSHPGTAAETRPSIEVRITPEPHEQPALANAPHRDGLVRGEQDPLLDHLAACFPIADRVDIAVAFVLDRGVRLIHPYIEDLLQRGKRLRLVTGDYFGVTEPDGLQSLLDLDGERELRVFESAGQSYHPKAYIFHLANGDGIAFVGSSNLSVTALGNGVEWNYRVVSSRDHEGFASVCAGFERLVTHPKTIPLSHAWIERYRKTRAPDAGRRQGLAPEHEPPPPPHGIQQQALAALRETREQGNVAGLVVLATGLGKTWLSAFDSRDFRRVLFVAHREEILDQARKTYRRIRPDARLGMYTGTDKAPEADVLFASIQTLGRLQHLSQFAPDHFDYVVVDEFHHAAAPTYRGLIEHFRPRFLLGLTATPERTDGADLLALCGHNLVFRCGLAEGVRARLLCPFHYHGVPDDVDYAEIPWRSSRFDEEELTRQLATARRAQNVLEQHARLGGQRTLAFCASQRHADFMAQFFQENGRRAAAVHTGANSAPRANSLERLRRGELDVVFSVDMFNEGVDVPDIDTVMMLRPTESRVLWLQQLGRGLRVTEAKDHLRVIDYIGNHRTFLQKPRALLCSLLGIGESYEELRAALKRLQDGSAELPAGCNVTYELETIEILERLLAPTKVEHQLRRAYEDFREQHGRRPTASELHGVSALSPSALKKVGSSWFGFVDSMKDLEAAGRTVASEFADLLRELETSAMQRSYKMLVLQAMLELDQLPGTVAVAELADRFQTIANRSPQLRHELAETLRDGASLVAMLRSNPLRAWSGTKRGNGSDFFALDETTFSTRFRVADEQRQTLQELVRELVDWRLAQYLDRRTGSTFECRVTHNDRNPILMLPSRDLYELPDGDVAVDADGEQFTVKFAKIAINVMRRTSDPDGPNVLPELLRSWFGDDAGLSGTSDRVRFEATKDGYRIEPVAERSATLVVHAADGRPLDARFLVEKLGSQIAVLFLSRGGTKGSPQARNTEYTPGLDALLARAAERRLTLTDALVDSKETRERPLAERRLSLPGADLPLDLRLVTDASTVRKHLARAQRQMGGNETRQLRLVFSGHGDASAEAVGRWLSGAPGESERR